MQRQDQIQRPWGSTKRRAAESIEWSQERFGDESCSGVQEELHLGNLLVYLFHELDDEVNKLVLEHLLGVEVCNEEGDVVSLDGFPSQNEERLGTLCQEASELVDQDMLNLVCLLDSDADADAVDAGLDEDALVLIAGDGQRVEKNFGRGLGFDLGDIVTFRRLRGEVG